MCAHTRACTEHSRLFTECESLSVKRGVSRRGRGGARRRERRFGGAAKQGRRPLPPSASTCLQRTPRIRQERGIHPARTPALSTLRSGSRSATATEDGQSHAGVWTVFGLDFTANFTANHGGACNKIFRVERGTEWCLIKSSRSEHRRRLRADWRRRSPPVLGNGGGFGGESSGLP